MFFFWFLYLILFETIDFSAVIGNSSCQQHSVICYLSLNNVVYRSSLLLELGRFCLEQNLPELGVQCAALITESVSSANVSLCADLCECVVC